MIVYTCAVEVNNGEIYQSIYLSCRRPSRVHMKSSTILSFHKGACRFCDSHFSEEMYSILALPLADALSVVADTPLRLENRLDLLAVYGNITVFKNGDYFTKYEKWSHNSTKLELVNSC